jgi:hypothetical protein
LGILALAGGAQIGSNAQAAFFQGLGDLGWVEGRNLLVERRIVEAPDERLAQAATELVRLRVDVILAAAGPASLNAARGATKAIPIVMVASSRDPIGTGLIQSYARPAGNITGLVTAPEELTGKQLELLKTAVQGLSRVGFLHDATVGPFQLERATVETSGLRSCPMGRAYSAYMKRMASGWQGSAIRQELGWSELVRRPEPKAATGFWA